MKTRVVVAFLILITSSRFVSAAVDDGARKAQLSGLAERLKYQQGQIHLGSGLATIHLPDSFRYLDPAGSETLLTGIWGNPSAGKKILGTIVPEGFDPFDAHTWCVVIEYEEDGYVKDNDAEKINYTKLLKQMQERTHEASAERVKNGYPAVELVGWAAAPRYDQQAHKFYWAKEIKFGDAKEENTLNYNLRILGRRGILVLNAVSGMSQFARIEKATPEILGMIDFDAGQRYADYTPGTDKLATYGLAALVARGIAAKAGLFKGLLIALLALKKFVVIGVIAVIALIKRIVTGKKAPPTISSPGLPPVA